MPAALVTTVWSPDGRWLAYTSQGLWLLPSKGGEPRKLADDALSSPVFSPDSREIAYSAGQNNAPSTRVVRVDGSGTRTLADGTTDQKADNPVWSPDGAWLAVRGRKHEPKTLQAEAFDKPTVDIMRPDGADRRRLGEDFVLELVSWLPDSSAVLATTGDTHAYAKTRLLVANVTGTQLTSIVDDAVRPSISPDHRWVVYDHYQYDSNGNTSDPEIRIRSLTNAAPERTLIHGRDAANFSWSPEGDALAMPVPKELVEGNTRYSYSLLTVTRLDGRGQWTAPDTTRGAGQFAFAPSAS
jgi:Tol biopolymer transport system component